MEILCVYCLAEFDIIKKFPISTISTTISTKVMTKEIETLSSRLSLFLLTSKLYKNARIFGEAS